MNETVETIQKLVKQMTAANKLAAIKELYQMGELSKEDYSKMLHDYLKNN